MQNGHRLRAQGSNRRTERLRWLTRLGHLAIFAALTLALLVPARPADAGINVWSSIGPEGGSVYDLAIDPEAPSTLYIAIYGGVYKSTNSGASWSAVNNGLPDTWVNALAINPENPAILYAGTLNGVYRSADGGASWDEMINGLNSTSIETLAIDPTAPAILYAGASGEVARSIDGGAHWSVVNSGLPSATVKALEIDPQTPSTLYAATANGLFKSANQGDSWAPLDTGLPTNTSFEDVVVNPNTPSTLYAAGNGAIVKSTNGGTSWSTSLASSATALAIDPSNPSIVYAGTNGVTKSTNAGGSWSPADAGLTVSWVYALAIDTGNPAMLYAATDGGGVFKSADRAANWSASNTGLVRNYIYDLAFDPTDSATLYAGTDGGVYKSTDRGASWGVFNEGLSDHRILELAIDPSDPSILYAGAVYGVFKSDDGGASWSEIGPQTFGIDLQASSLVIDPQTSTTVYAAGWRQYVPFTWGVYKSTNGGASWSSMTSGLTDERVNSLAIDPSNPATLYAGTATGLFKSVDGAENWSPANVGLPADTSIGALAIDPQTPTTLYAARGGAVYKSINSGASWSRVLLGSSVSSLAIDPQTPTTLYAGRFDGVQRSVDGGATWGVFGEGLPQNGIGALVVDPENSNNLYAGTGGRGAFAYQIDTGDLVYAKVVDQQGRPIAGAEIYRNGIRVSDPDGSQVTNAAGDLVLADLQPGDTLTAMLPVHQQPTVRVGHDGWAYRIYRTSMVVDPVGNVQPFTVTQVPGRQQLTIAPDNTLVLFNLLVSVEWDASAAYLQDLTRAIDQAADFLYDATDGQMTFGQVAIYDRAEHWADADIQVSAKNVVHPHAHVAGLTDDDAAHVVRVGRSWDGNSAKQGTWSNPNGFKTLVHEFGHYGLGLYDEYFGYNRIGGDLGGQRPASCTGPENRTAAPESAASIMDYHYHATELADLGRWTARCRQTAQHQLNNGEADWQTLVRRYGDKVSPARWRLVTPDQRAGLGKAVDGPNAIPAGLPFPAITTANDGADPPDVRLKVYWNDALYLDGAWVTLYFTGKAIDQGLTDDCTGALTILGAQLGGSLQVVSLDGRLKGSAPIATEMSIDLEPVAPPLGLAQVSQPHLRLWPTTGSGQLEGIQLAVSNTAPVDQLTYALTGPDKIGPADTLTYDSVTGEHRVRVGFIPAALAGHARVLGVQGGEPLDIHADYRLQQASSISETTLFSSDGNLKLNLDAGSLTLQEVFFAITTPWAPPGTPPPGLEIAGEVYEVTASNGITELERPAVLRLRHDPTSGVDFERLGIYHWNTGTSSWQPFQSVRDAEHQEVVTTVSDLGIYALMAEQPAQVVAAGAPAASCLSNRIYLPAVRR